MVDLGQKGWKQFHLFYWSKVKDIKKQDKKIDAVAISYASIFGIIVYLISPKRIFLILLSS